MRGGGTHPAHYGDADGDGNRDGTRFPYRALGAIVVACRRSPFPAWLMCMSQDALVIKNGHTGLVQSVKTLNPKPTLII